MTFIEEVIELKKHHNKLVIYGAGLYGQNLYKILKRSSILVDGFVVSQKTNETELFGLAVDQASEDFLSDAGIIIGVNRHNAKDVIAFLKTLQIDEKNVVNGYEYIDNAGIRGGYDEVPTIEITTVIGCGIQCRYCPQTLLIKKYFESNKNRKSIMSLEDFDYFLGRLPKECVLLFSGMAEPYQNPQCSEMIELAHCRGHKVDIYTTLVGAQKEDLDMLCRLPVDFMGLHVADELGYSKINISEEYLEKIEDAINRKKCTGDPLINVCNSQTVPDERILDICHGKYEILTTMLDRAGNLHDERLFSKKPNAECLSCSLCGKKLNHNILLPDGTVLLCCMDYGMKHVFGNLNDSVYEELLESEEYKRILNGLNGDLNVDILCRSCSCANPVR